MSDSKNPNGAPIPNGHARAAANKANAQKSTGPRTQAGKQRSSLNALRHVTLADMLTAITSDEVAAEPEVVPEAT